MSRTGPATVFADPPTAGSLCLRIRLDGATEHVRFDSTDIMAGAWMVTSSTRGSKASRHAHAMSGLTRSPERAHTAILLEKGSDRWLSCKRPRFLACRVMCAFQPTDARQRSEDAGLLAPATAYSIHEARTPVWRSISPIATSPRILWADRPTANRRDYFWKVSVMARSGIRGHMYSRACLTPIYYQPDRQGTAKAHSQQTETSFSLALLLILGAAR